MNRQMFRILTLAAILVSLPSSALAGGGFVMEVHGYYIIDFVVFVWALWYFAKKPMASFLENRRAEAAKEIDEAAELKGKAEERLARYEKQLASLEETREELHAEFTKDGENEKLRAMDEAKKTAERLQRDLERSVQQESAKLGENLEGRLAARAIELAEEKIKAKLTPSVQQGLVTQFIADLKSVESLGDFDNQRAQG